MKYLYLVLILFLVAIAQGQTSQDTLYVWKSGQLVIKQSIKPADMDSITFKRPIFNTLQVTICNQLWATKNLDVTTYSDGTPIPQVTDPTQWAGLTTGAWCYYNNDPANDAVYGKLFNWYAAAGIYDAASLADPTLRKNLAPTGWHVPTDVEWTTLTDCLGGQSVAGGKMKETGTAHWQSPNTAATNSSGFTGLPGGGRSSYDGSFIAIGSNGLWWSSSERNSASAWYRNVGYAGADVGIAFESKGLGLSVRCLKN